jgi:hypothetical protein
MRKRVVVAIITLAICLLIIWTGAPFFSYLVHLLFGGNLQFHLEDDGTLYVVSSTGNTRGPLWGFALIILGLVAFIIAIVILLLEMRNRSKNRKQILQSYVT